MERLVIGVAGPADRLLAAGLDDLGPVLSELQGNVIVVGGLMARAWLHLRPIEEIPPRATADVDLGVDRKGLRLTSSTEKVRPLLEAIEFRSEGGDEGFRFRKEFDGGEALMVDVFVAKGASRDEPPVLEKGVVTLAAPGLAYALQRGPYFVECVLVDGDTTTEIELPLPTLDAAFVLKGALAASGVRTRPDRRDRDRVDAVMLAAACLSDEEALAGLGKATSGEARKAITWLQTKVNDPRSAVARTLENYLEQNHQLPGGGEWAAAVAANFSQAVATRTGRRGLA
jgi:hypothetical protein